MIAFRPFADDITEGAIESDGWISFACFVPHSGRARKDQHPRPIPLNDSTGRLSKADEITLHNGSM